MSELFQTGEVISGGDRAVYRDSLKPLRRNMTMVSNKAAALLSTGATYQWEFNSLLTFPLSLMGNLTSEFDSCTCRLPFFFMYLMLKKSVPSDYHKGHLCCI